MIAALPEEERSYPSCEMLSERYKAVYNVDDFTCNPVATVEGVVRTYADNLRDAGRDGTTKVVEEILAERKAA